MASTEIPDIVIGRLPVYLRALSLMAAAGQEITLSHELGEKLGIEVPPPQIRIAPPEVPSPPPSRRMIITDNTVKTLEEAAQQFSDPRLSAAVMRLAEHARQRNRQS